MVHQRWGRGAGCPEAAAKLASGLLASSVCVCQRRNPGLMRLTCPPGGMPRWQMPGWRMPAWGMGRRHRTWTATLMPGHPLSVPTQSCEASMPGAQP